MKPKVKAWGWPSHRAVGGDRQIEHVICTECGNRRLVSLLQIRQTGDWPVHCRQIMRLPPLDEMANG